MILWGIVFFGLVLDFSVTYNFWNQLRDNEEIFNLIIEHGQGFIDQEMIKALLVKMAPPIGIMLVIFLVWDLTAYLFLLKYKNWARKYVLSISIFYLLSCLFSFSFIPFIYGTLTTVALFKYGDLFKRPTESHKEANARDGV